MIVYSWYDTSEGDGTRYFATLSEARRELKEHLSAGAEGMSAGATLGPIEIRRDDVGPPTKRNVVAMLNVMGFVRSSTKVESWRGVPCKKCDACQTYYEVESTAWPNCTRKRVVRVKTDAD